MVLDGPGSHTNNLTLPFPLLGLTREKILGRITLKEDRRYFSPTHHPVGLSHAPRTGRLSPALSHITGPGPDGPHGPAPDMDQRAREYGPGPGSGPHGQDRDSDQRACTSGPHAPHTTARTPTLTIIQLRPEAAGPTPTARPLLAQIGGGSAAGAPHVAGQWYAL